MKIITKIIIMLLVLTLTACGGMSKTRKNEIADKKEAASINVQLASGYMQRGQFEIAKEKLLKAIEIDDGFVPAYTTMAVLMNRLGEVEEAEEYFVDALDIDSNNPELLNNYGTFLCQHNKIEEAKEQFNKAINNQLYETPHVAHGNLGYCMMKSVNPDYVLAEKHLRKALEADPKMRSSLMAMGELGIQTRRYLMARAYMQRYHAITRPSSSSLWLQIQAEKALGDQKYLLKLTTQLLDDFPESQEASKLKRAVRR
ncbi:MAG: type IV pilus biogenesis/stability protein PilW [Gammaproteobacteria bacterium]|nr:type IV pilus biogenesis/stability protein PilW [Gammaproteobacteria bacterium]MCW8909753.1 type IV pilus biogenesis/stability protein PilW [Gammaproteobacteria bacterium]MCW9003771.1 type IV pilus biogenesis/stability protein PilW [Gammaproteobacteria bacterium]MCW9057128.1 type IV pilus biogenesis/stability protein PilW [Gammaproteobacteria bacterium]